MRAIQIKRSKHCGKLGILTTSRPSSPHVRALHPARTAYSARRRRYLISTGFSTLFASRNTSQHSISAGQSTDASSHLSPRDSQSPKEDHPSVPKPDDAFQQQPAKPQVTFLTKFYTPLFPETHLSLGAPEVAVLAAWPWLIGHAPCIVLLSRLRVGVFRGLRVELREHAHDARVDLVVDELR
ncbi:hypothetical protein LXA43DRAFT_1094015 [Ganoderma leucocontextum]|nr:hypothetical protein LXA43DRAFT_1094015 [Ganoderma leucocontextum]